MDTALLSWVQSAEKHGKDFSSSINAELKLIEKDLESENPKMQTSGENMILGIIKGMQAEMPALNAEVATIIADVDRAVKAEAEIKSPSELMARNGEEMMRGLSLGINRTAHEPALAASNAVGGVAAATGGGGAAGGQTHIYLQVDKQTLGSIVCDHINDMAKLNGPIPARI
jgi:hypothetical protein